MHPLLHLELNRIRTEELLAEAEAYRLARIARPVRPARPALRFSLGARPPRWSRRAPEATPETYPRSLPRAHHETARHARTAAGRSRVL